MVHPGGVVVYHRYVVPVHQLGDGAVQVDVLGHEAFNGYAAQEDLLTVGGDQAVIGDDPGRFIDIVEDETALTMAVSVLHLAHQGLVHALLVRFVLIIIITGIGRRLPAVLGPGTVPVPISRPIAVGRYRDGEQGQG